MKQCHALITACCLLGSALGSALMSAEDFVRPGIPDAAYVSIDSAGHLQQHGKRVRYWGFIGYLTNPGMSERVAKATEPTERAAVLAKIYADHELMAQRQVDLGFNLHRLWEPTFPSGLLSHDYQPGDGSYSDLIAHQLFTLDRKGIAVWMSSINHGTATAEDAHIIDDPATEPAWKIAVAAWIESNKGRPIRLRDNLARFYDARWEAIGIDHMRRMANFPNLYKGGLRWADDPQIVVWELSNEEWAFGRFIGGEWRNQPAYFQEQLLRRWHAFLVAKYHDDAGLAKAWSFLLPGESLNAITVQLAPLRGATAPVLVGDPNPETLKRLSGGRETLSRDDFTRQRGADVCEFFVDLIVTHKQRERDALKTWGRSTASAPCIFDTGIGYEIQAQYLHQQADAVAHCTYMKGMAHDPSDRRYPFRSGLEEPPRLAWDVPWLEHNKVAGKPFFVYENQIDNRTKYRAEYPLRLAALGSTQDWDIINWHDFGNTDDSSQADPHAGKLEVGHSLNLHFEHDEVQNSAMRAAADIFKHVAIAPAPSPATFTYGRRALYDPASMDYGASYGTLGKSMLPTSYRQGVRIRIDPTLDDHPEDPLFGGDKGLFARFIHEGGIVQGPSWRPRISESCPIRPTPKVTYDWQEGYLSLDSPAALAWTGFWGRRITPVTFADGSTFDRVKVVNPAGMPYPVTPDEGYVALALTSCDGQPLSTTNEAMLSAVSTSFNTGYQLNHGQTAKEFKGLDVANAGESPVLVARVECDITSPAIDGMTFTMLDYHMRTLGTGTVVNGHFHLSAELPVFLVRFTR